MKKLVFVFLTLLYAIVSVAQPLKPSDPIPIDPNVRIGVLSNGMKYLIRKNIKPEKRVELRLVVNIGSTAEDDDQQGLAHIVEHMAFNGTKNFKKNDLVNFIESVGMKFGPDLNAYTSFNETVYMLQMPTEKEEIYKKGFQILEDWAHNLSFDSLEVEKERGVVMEEWRLRLGAGERMRRIYFPVLFKGSRYADRLPIGKPEIIQNFKHSVLKRFYNEWYRPELMALIVVGDINVDETEKLIKEQFSKIEEKKNPRKVITWEIPNQNYFRKCSVSDKENNFNYIQLYYFNDKLPNGTFADYREDTKRGLISSMLGSRIEENTLKPNPPLLFGNANLSGFMKNKSAFTGFAAFANGKCKDAVQTLLFELMRAREFGFTQTELDRGKKDILTSYENAFNERDKSNSSNYVNEYIRHFTQDEGIPGIENELKYVKEILPTVTLKELNDMYKSWLRPKEQNAMLLGIFAAKDSVKIPSENDLENYMNDAEKNMKLVPYDDKTIDGPLVQNMPTPQKVVSSKEIGYGITEWILSNGTKILLKPTDFKNDEILFNSYSWGGTNAYQDRDEYNASYSSGIQSSMSYGNFDLITMQKFMQGKIAGAYANIGGTSESVSGSCNRKDIETMFQLIYNLFTSPRKDTAAFKNYVQRIKTFIQNRGASPEETFRDTIFRTMSKYHPRTKPVTEKDLDKINLDRCMEIYKERIKNPGEFVFVFVGSFKLDSIKPVIEKYIGGIPSQNRNEQRFDLGIKTPDGKISKEIYKGKEPKSAVQLIWNGEIPFTRRNRFESNALSSLLNIKLRENLREDKSGVYGIRIGGSLDDFPKGTFRYTCSFGCAPDRVKDLISEVKKEIEKVKSEGCSEENLKKIKENFIKEREVQLKENNFWLTYILNADMYNEKLSDLDLYNSWVNELKSDDFKRLAKYYFDNEKVKEYVLYPEK